MSSRKTRRLGLWLPVADSAALAELETAVSRRVVAARRIVYLLLGIGGFLVLLNLLTRSTEPQLTFLVRWWSIMPLTSLALLAVLPALAWVWLLPRALETQRRLLAMRPLHAPSAEVLAAGERLRRRLAGLPGKHPELEAELESGLALSRRLVEAPAATSTETEEMDRRAVVLETYRATLGNLEIDAALGSAFLGSTDSARRLECALEPLRALDEGAEDAADVSTLATSGIESIVVLPFADLSPLNDQEYFAQGLAEELINALTKLRRLRVTARSLAFASAREGRDVREVGRRLNVEAVLEGSVQKVSGRLRVTARLVSVADGVELWSDHFDREIEDVFEIQDELARSVVQALRVTPTSEERREIEKPTTLDVKAYDYYLRGRQFFTQYRTRGMEFALEMFRHAIELDAGYARAYAGIAECCAFLFANAGRDPDNLEQALEASRKALELDPELAQAHLARAVALSYSGRWDEAEGAFQTSIRLNPKLFETHYFCARHHFIRGEPERAIEFYEKAAELCPEDYQGPLLSAQVYDDLERHEEAAAVRRRGIRVAEEHLRLNPDDTRALYMAANGLAALGRTAEGLKLADRARELEPTESMVLYNVACIYSLAGELEKAIECLDEAVQHGFRYRDWLEHDNNLDAVRNHPAFLALMKRF